MKPWYRLPQGRSRLARDREAAALYVPLLSFGPLCGKIHLRGVVHMTVGDSGIVRSIPTRIEFPDDYSRSEPSAFVGRGFFEPQTAVRHFRGDGSCCLWYTRAEDGWNGHAADAFEHFLQQLLIFYDRQLTYDAIGEFPGPVWGHDRPIARLFLEDRLSDASLIDAFKAFRRGKGVAPGAPCPCGSARQFETCHLVEFADLQHRLSGADFATYDQRELDQKAND